MTLESLFGSAIAAALVGFGATFNSVFLFVTGAFNFSGAGFATARDELFAFDATAFNVVAGAALVTLVTLLAGALSCVFEVEPVFVAATFFKAGFAIDLPEVALVAEALAFFAAGAGFTGFFIAFAMEIIPTGCSHAPSELRLVEPKIHRLCIRPRDHFSLIVSPAATLDEIP